MPTKPTQGSSAPPPPPPILGLRVSEEADEDKASALVPETDVKFLAIAAVLDLGLRLLESPAGKAGLESIGCNLITILKDHEHLYDKNGRSSRNTIPEWTALFLTRLRATFPCVVLTNHLGGEGQVARLNWADPSKPNSKMLEWDPSSAGIFRLNKFIMEGLIQAGQLATQNKTSADQEAFESFMFLMAITVAHELCHLYVGFFVGYNRPMTPEDISFLPELYNKPYDDNMVGESGRAWEGRVLGGVVETFYDPSHHLKARQPGKMYIIDKYKMTRPVPSSTIKALVGLNLGNLKILDPILAAQPAKPLGWMDEKYKTMKEVRLQAIKARGVGLAKERSRSASRAEVVALRKSAILCDGLGPYEASPAFGQSHS
ncbi:hypothetical protein F5883DRAFT_657167 [Diaporthe sp. PMI_573]|nr:hypothetical protein F5883DRAFT_657167 [Diaporthaceae sp. PMI_573]